MSGWGYDAAWALGVAERVLAECIEAGDPAERIAECRRLVAFFRDDLDHQ